jgi:hypothetical protein
MAHTGAIIDRDAVAVRRRSIDEYPQHPASAGLRKLDIDQFILQRLDRRLQQAHQGVTHSLDP